MGYLFAQETSEDRAVNKVIAEAAIEAAARTSQSDTSPGVTMREGQQQFAAMPETGAKKASEPLTTEADIVSPAKGVGAGDRLVDPKQAKPKAAKRESAAAKAKASTDPFIIMSTPSIHFCAHVRRGQQIV